MKRFIFILSMLLCFSLLTLCVSAEEKNVENTDTSGTEGGDLSSASHLKPSGKVQGLGFLFCRERQFILALLTPQGGCGQRLRPCWWEGFSASSYQQLAGLGAP